MLACHLQVSTYFSSLSQCWRQKRKGEHFGALNHLLAPKDQFNPKCRCCLSLLGQKLYGSPTPPVANVAKCRKRGRVDLHGAGVLTSSSKTQFWLRAEREARSEVLFYLRDKTEYERPYLFRMFWTVGRTALKFGMFVGRDQLVQLHIFLCLSIHIRSFIAQKASYWYASLGTWSLNTYKFQHNPSQLYPRYEKGGTSACARM